MQRRHPCCAIEVLLCLSFSSNNRQVRYFCQFCALVFCCSLSRPPFVLAARKHIYQQSAMDTQRRRNVRLPCCTSHSELFVCTNGRTSHGEVLFDCIARPEAAGWDLDRVVGSGAWAPYPGGAPANVACALSKLGISATFVGAVGCDEDGEQPLFSLALFCCSFRHATARKQQTRGRRLTISILCYSFEWHTHHEHPDTPSARLNSSRPNQLSDGSDGVCRQFRLALEAVQAEEDR